jgi:hypothetical protein
MISGNDFLSVTFREEVDLELSTGSDVGESGVGSFFVGDDWRLGVGVSEEDTHPFVFLLGLDQSKWMNTVCLLSTLSVIIRSCSTVTPHGPCSWCEREFSGSFSKTVDSLTWNLEIKLHKFVSHDEIRILCINVYHVFDSSAFDLKAEWIESIIKSSHIR